METTDLPLLLWNKMAEIASRAISNPNASEDEKTAILFCSGGMNAEITGENSWNLTRKPEWSLPWSESERQWIPTRLTVAPDARIEISVGSVSDLIPEGADVFDLVTNFPRHETCPVV